MKAKLLSIFENYRESIIKALFELVDNSPSKCLKLNPTPAEFKLEIEETVFKYEYRMLFIQDNELLLNYSCGEGIEPYEYVECTEDICLFSMDEIYNIINHIIE